MEGPADPARAHVESANVAQSGGQVLGHQRPENQQVFIDDARAGCAHREVLIVPAEPLLQIHAAGVAEPCHRMAGVRIERVQVLVDAHVDACVVAIGPVIEPAIALLAVHQFFAMGVEVPDQFARGRIERDHPQARRGCIEHAIDHQGIALDLRAVVFVARIESPRELQPAHVLAVDLLQRRVVHAVLSAGDAPITAGAGFPWRRPHGQSNQRRDVAKLHRR